VADVVAPLTYAIAGRASAALVRDYKNKRGDLLRAEVQVLRHRAAEVA